MSKKKHPWKICSSGSYYVKAHYKIISGVKHHWRAHCRKNRSSKDTLNTDEIHEVSKNFKNEELKMPKAYDFKTPKGLGNKYDLLIAGWVKYWRDIYGEDSKITADLVKVLMMSESTFRIRATAKIHKTRLKAIGLMQITDYTYKLIQENQKELRNHVFNIRREDLFDPNVNIAVGVRWLFRKREIAKYYLKKEPTMLELAEEYKGIRNDKSFKANQQRKIFKEKLQEFKKAKV